jgi:hypothetical protein
VASNWMELNLSPAEDAFVRAQAALYQAQYIKTIDTIFDTAKAIKIIADRHRNSGISGAYGDALVQYGFIARDGGPMNKAIRSFYNTLLEHEATVRTWWEAVPERKKRDWLSAKAVYTHWDRSRRPPEPKPSYAGVKATAKPQSTTVTGDSAEIAALKEKLARAEARITELEVDIIRMTRATGVLPNQLPSAATMARMRMQEAAARKAKRDEAKAQQAAAALAQPGAPDAATLMAENEELKQQLKALKTRVRNIKGELYMAREWKDAAEATGMSFATRGTIMKPLHPDTRKHLNEVELQAALDAACRVFTAWTGDIKPARPF